MASIDLSSNAREIQSTYDAIVAGDSSISWAVYSYGAGLNNNTLKLQATGSGDLSELQEELSEGKIQYAFARVLEPNSQLPKFVLIGMCGEGVPERAKGYFNAHFNSVSRLFHGYHVQITARSIDDADPDEILRKVTDASGSKYSVADLASKFGKAPPVRPKYASSHPTSAAAEDDWGDAPPVVESKVTKVPSAYKPHKVDIDAIRKGNSSERASAEPVKSSYQPIGKVDIAAIRASASKKELEAEKPDIVKGTYQPIGKVDIAAIRAQAKQNEESTSKPKPFQRAPEPEKDEEEKTKPASLAERSEAFTASGRLSELPKPKIEKSSVASRFGGASKTFGTAPVLPSNQFSNAPKTIGGLKNFGAEGGKTPAQLWAERKAKENGGSAPAASSSTPAASFVTASERPEETEEEEKPHRSISALRDRFARASVEDEEEKEEEEPERPSSPIRLARPVASATSIIRPAGGFTPKAPEPESEPEPEPEPEQEEPEVEEEPAAPEPPKIDFSSRPSLPRRGPTPEPEEEEVPEPEPEPVQEEEEEEEDMGAFAKGRAAAAAALSSGDIMGDPAPAKAPEPEPSASSSSGKVAVVLYEYMKEEDNEINLVEGELIHDIEEVDEGWWSGRNSEGEQGLFPANYVEIQSDDAAPAETATEEPAPALSVPSLGVGAAGPSAKAEYDYEAEEDNELTFPEGATISDIQFPDEDWWSGVYEGKRGLFPSTYVSLV